MKRLALVIIAVLLLAGCQGGPIVVVATAPPPDAAFHTYRHPTGAFTIRLPSDWSIRDVSRDNSVRVEFSPPGNDGLPLSVYVINTGTVLDTAALLENINKFQSVINGSQYTELARNAQGDGSWRLVGIRQTPIGARQLNTFIQADKSFLSAIEVDITGAGDAQLQLYRNVINTYRADPTASLSTNQVENVPAAAANTSSGSIVFDGLLEWTDSTGGFNINGQLTNTAPNAIEAVRVSALLYDAQDRLLAEQPDIIPNEVVGAGDTVPFTIRFRSGKPAQAVRYELQAAARNAEYNLQNYLGPDSFIKGNEKAGYNAQGYLTVSGDIVNKTQQAAKFIRVTVTVLDEQNRVVGAENAFVEKPELLPGDVSKYEVTFYQLAGSAGRFVTKVEGRLN